MGEHQDGFRGTVNKACIALAPMDIRTGRPEVNLGRAQDLAAQARQAGADWSVVHRLIERGQLAEATYNGRAFYLRKLRRT